MTSLLTHTFPHSTRPSFMPKINNQLLKKFNSCGQLSKSFLKWQNSDFQSQFSVSKINRIFWKIFSLKNLILGAHLLLLTFLETSIFEPLYFLKLCPIFDWLQDLKNFGFGPKERPGRMCDSVSSKWGHTNQSVPVGKTL